jgi:hypothetical protein
MMKWAGFFNTIAVSRFIRIKQRPWRFLPEELAATENTD